MVGTKGKIRCLKMSSQAGIGYMHQQISGIQYAGTGLVDNAISLLINLLIKIGMEASCISTCRIRRLDGQILDKRRLSGCYRR
jgi:hypothetical protein